MFQFTALASYTYLIGCMIIQGSRDQRLFDGFPELIAAFHALHRLLTPRHPPHALSSLTTMILASSTLPPDFSRSFRCPHRSQSVRSKKQVATAFVSFCGLTNGW